MSAGRYRAAVAVLVAMTLVSVGFLLLLTYRMP